MLGCLLLLHGSRISILGTRVHVFFGGVKIPHDRHKSRNAIETG